MHESRAGASLGWLSSLLLHSVAFVVLALASMPEMPVPYGAMLQFETVSTDEVDESLDLSDIEVEISSDLTELSAVDATSLDRPDTPLDVGFDSSLNAPEPVSLSAEDFAAPIVSSSFGVAGEGVDGRQGDAREALVESKGGTRASEVAVARALNWIAEHQNRDGSWSLVHGLGPCNGRCNRSADFDDAEKGFRESLISGTSLALLPFLGAGETHYEGKHKRVVERGLAALVRLGEKPSEGPGVSWSDNGRLYAHGLSAIVLTEAYGLTGDTELRAPAQAAIDHITFAQDPSGGGWRYRPQQPGDTSASGWQIMALKSAQLAELSVPAQTTRRASRFLDTVQVHDGSRYRYMPPEEGQEEGDGTRSLTAVGLLCRMYMGWDEEDERLKRGVEFLVDRGPHEGNYYHNYYAAQTIFHVTGGEGPLWRAWNEPMREQLVDQQETRGHQRGSWWVPGPHNARGGRLYTTSLAAMTLEVYYRYLPLFQSGAVSTEFPD